MTISNPSLTQISQALAEMLPKLKPLSVPTGMISAFHTVPEGWLQCNGAAVSRTTYAALFAVIGTKYGSGDGSNTFNLPHLHHKFIEGTTTQSEVGQSVSAGLPNITGYVAVDDNVGRNANVCGGAFSKGAKTTGSSKGGGVNNGLYPLNLDASKSSSTYGKSTTVQPQSMRVLAIIKS